MNTDKTKTILQNIEYQDNINTVKGLKLDSEQETIWATTKQIAELFKIDESGITKHISNVLKDGELAANSVTAKIATTASDGKKYQVSHYNLDMIIAVGYRISSKQATKFRQWASTIIKQFVLQGFAIDGQRLKNDSVALNKLAYEVRKLRNDEKNIYEAVRKSFGFAVDYKPKSDAVSKFYAKLQNTFYYAVCGLVADELRLRADSKSFKMNAIGAITLNKTTAGIAKNYLNTTELYALYIVSEQFLLFVESAIIRRKKLTIESMYNTFCDMLELQGYNVLGEDYNFNVKKIGLEHAQREWEVYKKSNKKKEDAKTNKEIHLLNQGLKIVKKRLDCTI